MKFLVNLILFIIGFFSSSLFFSLSLENWHNMFVTTNYIQGMCFTAFVLSIVFLIISLILMIGTFFNFGN